MKKKIYTRPVSVVLSDEVFEQIKTIADEANIGLSDVIRVAIQEKLDEENRSDAKEAKL